MGLLISHWANPFPHSHVKYCGWQPFKSVILILPYLFTLKSGHVTKTTVGINVQTIIRNFPGRISLKVSLFVFSCAEWARPNKCSADELRRNHAKWSPVCQHLAECWNAFQTGKYHVPKLVFDWHDLCQRQCILINIVSLPLCGMV